MKSQGLFSERIKKNISKCCLLNFLPSILSVKSLHSALYAQPKIYTYPPRILDYHNYLFGTYKLLKEN